MRKFFLLSMFLLILVAQFPVVVTDAAEPEKVAVVSEGVGPTKMAALQSAWLEAVRKGVGLFMTSKTEIVNDDISEKIITHSRGQVNSYKVISEAENNGVWHVVIEANIDKDILQQTASQSQSAKMKLDAADIAAKEDTGEKRQQSEQEVLAHTLDDLDLGKLLRYQAQLKKMATPDGKTVFYVENTLGINPAQFKIMADQLERTLAPVARTKQTLRLEPAWGKKVAWLLNNWTYSENAERLNYYMYNLASKDGAGAGNLATNSRANLAEWPRNSICIYKSAGKAVCYVFDKNALSNALREVKRSYVINFEANGGDDFSEISPSYTVRWPFYSEDSFNSVFVDPILGIRGGEIVNLRYNQQLTLDREQMVNIKEITGEYGITKQ